MEFNWEDVEVNHYSGHRNCKYAASPADIEKNGTTCPVCKRRVTEGVDIRIKQLADEKLKGRAIVKKDNAGVMWYADKLGLQPPYVKLVPLLEIVAEAMYSTVASQKSKMIFADLCKRLGSEMEVLLKVSTKEIEKVAGERVAEGVGLARAGKLVIHPGYDGEYGVVRIWDAPAGASLRKRRRNAVKKVVKGQTLLDI